MQSNHKVIFQTHQLFCRLRDQVLSKGSRWPSSKNLIKRRYWQWLIEAVPWIITQCWLLESQIIDKKKKVFLRNQFKGNLLLNAAFHSFLFLNNFLKTFFLIYFLYLLIELFWQSNSTFNIEFKSWNLNTCADGSFL